MRQVRSARRGLGAPARVLLIGLIRAYRATLSGWLGGQCRFYPSCSVYAEDAIHAHGALRGAGLAVWRVLRCNPFGAGGPEPIPEGHQPGRPQYDSAIHLQERGAGA